MAMAKRKTFEKGEDKNIRLLENLAVTAAFAYGFILMFPDCLESMAL